MAARDLKRRVREIESTRRASAERDEREWFRVRARLVVLDREARELAAEFDDLYRDSERRGTSLSVDAMAVAARFEARIEHLAQESANKSAGNSPP